MESNHLNFSQAFWEYEISEHRQVFELSTSALAGPFNQALSILEETIRQGKKILLFGNGGSAADAQHIAAELVVRYKKDRLPIPALALTTDTSLLTACGNDLGFEFVFARQIEAIAQDGDVVIGISTSGNSPNIVAAMHSAHERKARTIGLTGQGGGKLKGLCEVLIPVPSDVTARIQEMHILIGHILCKALEYKLGLV